MYMKNNTLLVIQILFFSTTKPTVKVKYLIQNKVHED